MTQVSATSANPSVRPNPSVRSAIAQASQRTDTDFDYLMAQARLESGYNAQANAPTSSAAGLYQFIEQTWLETIDSHGADHGLQWAANAVETQNGRARISDPAMRHAVLQLRYDPQIASLMAGELAGDNAAHLQAGIGRAPDQTELYLAHFLGASGAQRFITAHQDNPGQSAAGLFADAASANRSIFYDNARALSLEEVRSRFAQRLEAATASAVPSPAATAGTSAAALAAGPSAQASVPAAPPRAHPMAPIQPQRPVAMADLLASTFGAAATNPANGGQIARAYDQFARFGL